MFKPELDMASVNTMKWTYEKERTKDPSVLCAGTADMDFPCAQPILDAISNVAAKGYLGYPYIAQDFYDSIGNWLKRTTNWKVNAKECVATAVGIYSSAWVVIDAFTNPGDEVIIQTPVHSIFEHTISINKRVTVVNPLKLENNRYVMDFEQLEQCFSKKTKIFWLCNPQNPVGRLWTREELTQLAEICMKHRVLIMSDDVYCGLVNPGHTYIPIASLSEEISQNTITLYSTSKSYNTIELRFSYLLTENQKYLEQILHSLWKLHVVFGQNIIGIEATKAAYNHCDLWLSELMEYVQVNYEYLKKSLEAKIPDVKIFEPDATYFAWLDLNCLSYPQKITEFLEKEAHLIVESGNDFGKGGEGFIRVNMATNHKVFHDISDRLTEALMQIKSS